MLTCPVCDGDGEEQFHNPGARVLRCRQCGHWFSAPAEAAPEQQDAAYFQQAYSRWFDHPDLTLYARIGKAIGDRSGRLLDVGCGTGSLLKFLRPRHPGLDLVGIDLDAPAQDIDGIRFVHGDVLTHEFSEKFDVITSLYVIRFVGDSKAYARRISDLAKPGALVVISTGAGNSLLYGVAHLLKRVGIGFIADKLYNKMDLNHFTTRSLHRLLTDHGLVHQATLRSCPPMESRATQETGLAATVVHFGLLAVHIVSGLTGTGYHQTVFYRKPDSAAGEG